MNDSTETLVRDTFRAASERLVVGEPPPLSAAVTVTPLPRRPPGRPGRWLAAAATVPLVAGIGWIASTDGPRLPVSTTPSTATVPDRPAFAPFAEPTWVPDGLALLGATQNDRPPQYTADVVTVAGEHATLHWTVGDGVDEVVWRDPGRPGGTDAPAGAIELPAAERTRSDLRAWAEPTPAPYSTRARPPAAPSPASAATIRTLLRDLSDECASGPCDRFSGNGLLPTTITRQGPDEVHGAPVQLSYWGTSGGYVSVTTWPVVDVLPAATNGVLPTAGLVPAATSADDVTLDDVEVSGRPALLVEGAGLRDLFVEVPAEGVTVRLHSVQSTYASTTDETVPAMSAATLVRMAESLALRPGDEFADAHRRTREALVGTVLTTIDTGTALLDIAEYAPGREIECRLVASVRRPDFGTATFGVDVCTADGRSPDTPNGPVRLFSPMLRSRADRTAVGIFENSVASVTIESPGHPAIRRPTVSIPGTATAMIAVDIPSGPGTVTLRDAAGATIATPDPVGYEADQAWQV